MKSTTGPKHGLRKRFGNDDLLCMHVAGLLESIQGSVRQLYIEYPTESLYQLESHAQHVKKVTIYLGPQFRLVSRLNPQLQAVQTDQSEQSKHRRNPRDRHRAQHTRIMTIDNMGTRSRTTPTMWKSYQK